VRINGRNVLLTGASTGIGAALARQFHAAGARLALLSRQTHTYELPGAVWIPADLTRDDERQRAFAAAEAALGHIDLLVNNAGAGAYTPTVSAEDRLWNQLYEINLNAPIHLTRLALPGMLKRRRGLIVNVASLAAQVPLPWLTLYSTAKAGLLTFTHGLRMELRGTGVTTVAVCPGYVQTPFQANALVGEPPLMLKRTKKFAITPEQCAADILRGIERESRTVITPWTGRLLNLLYFLAPGVVDRKFARYNRNLE
jgi:short-subunit dehydrogenase